MTRTPLSASEILQNIQELKGFKTKKNLAEFFGVRPSAISDWVHRNGNRIPPKHLERAALNHELRWQWLLFGESPPYETECVDTATGVRLAPDELELIERVKNSPSFRRAVDKLLGLDDDKVKLLAKVAESMSAAGPPADAKIDKESPFHRWNSGFPLTSKQ